MKKYFLLLMLVACCAWQSLPARFVPQKETYFHLKEIQKNNPALSPANMGDSLRFEMRLADLSKASDEKLLGMEKTVSNLKIYGMVGLLLVAFLVFQMTVNMNRKLVATSQVLDSKIDLTKHDLDRYLYELEKEAVRIDNRLVQVLHEQLSLIKHDRSVKIAEQPLLEFIPVTDHRLPIKVGEEIHRMRKRIENMDKEVKGLSALVNSINRLDEELTGSGYEMEELIGKKYVSGMKMEARFVDNPDIPPGEERITDVLRPEIKYKGEVIQVAKVEVGKSY